VGAYLVVTGCLRSTDPNGEKNSPVENDIASGSEGLTVEEVS
jgi:hypothetical protein